MIIITPKQPFRIIRQKFPIPWPPRLRSFVKVTCAMESFWLRVIQLREFEIVGCVDNELVNTADHGLRHRDLVCVERRHCIDWMP